MICAAKQMYLGDHIKEEAMGRLYGGCGGENKCMQGFGGETWRKETTWKT